MGAHIAGYAGERLKAQQKRKLGRITALDPAQPLFQGMPDFVRLDRGDANFVDVIHTDAKSILMGGGTPLNLLGSKAKKAKAIFNPIQLFRFTVIYF